MRALEGILVVAFEHSVGGPYCTRLLADLGADVIKIERRQDGDFSRAWDNLAKGLSSNFLWLNRNKKSLTLNVKSREGREILKQLIERCDVFVQNFAPGVVERLGVGYKNVRRLNPRLIYCNISGYGSKGPYGKMKAYDLLVQGESGLMSLTGSPDSPARVGISICDISSGVMAAVAILSALFQRERIGEGQEINVTMFEAILDWLSYPIICYLNSGVRLERTGMRHGLIVPYGVYVSRDGKLINFAVEQNEEWARFCKMVLSKPDLITSPAYATNQLRFKNRKQLEDIIEQEFRRRSREDLVKLLREAEIPYGLVNDIASISRHPQLRHLRMIEKPAGYHRRVRILRSAVHLSKSRDINRPAPRLGEHTETILRWLGYERSKIEEMRRTGVI